MVGSIAVSRLPDGLTTEITWRRPDQLQEKLLERWGIEVPVMSWPAAPRRLIRISAQLYNSPQHYARLAEALGQELAEERGRRAEPSAKY